MRNKPSIWAKMVQRMCLRGITETIQKIIFRIVTDLSAVFFTSFLEENIKQNLKAHSGDSNQTLLHSIIYLEINISHNYLTTILTKWLFYLPHLVIQPQTVDCIPRPNRKVPNNDLIYLVQRSKLHSKGLKYIFLMLRSTACFKLPFNLIYLLLNILNSVFSTFPLFCSLYFIPSSM